MCEAEDLKGQLRRVLASLEQLVRRSIARFYTQNGLQPAWDDKLMATAIKWSHDKSKRCGRPGSFPVTGWGRSF